MSYNFCHINRYVTVNNSVVVSLFSIAIVSIWTSHETNIGVHAWIGK